MASAGVVHGTAGGTPEQRGSTANCHVNVRDHDAMSDDEDGGYFNVRTGNGPHSPGSIRSQTMSIPTSMTPSTTAASLTALQYLPVPLLVLSSLKTVVLANEAMGRLLNIDLTALSIQEGRSPEDGFPSSSEALRGQTMAQLGIDMLQNGTPIWVVWEEFLDSILDQSSQGTGATSSTDAHDLGDNGSQGSGASTPMPTKTSSDGDAPKNDPLPLSRSNLAAATVHEVAVDVVIANK
ncbi:hypothetical protein LTS18_010317, partial [Coniosporium uncinatum]